MGKEQWKFKRFYFITSFALIFVITVGMGIYFVSEKYKEFQQYALADKISNIENKKTVLKSIVDSFVQQVSILIENSEANLDEKLRNRVYNAHITATNIYESMSGDFTADETKTAVS